MKLGIIKGEFDPFLGEEAQLAQIRGINQAMDDQEGRWDALNRRIVACRDCPRLVAWREEVARKKKRAFQGWDYWGKPVTGFGDHRARLLIVGLAPGAHGSNRTGRVFTGDDSGVFLYRALYRAGFANQPSGSTSDDGLALTDVYVSAVCRCVPPDNKPTPTEMMTCLPFLGEEIDLLSRLEGIVLLGRIALEGMVALYRSRGVPLKKIDFKHAEMHVPAPGLPWWMTSYHPSRQNTQTGRLTEAMFDEVWMKARAALS